MAYINALIDFWAFVNTLIQNPDVETNINGYTGNVSSVTQDGAHVLSGSFSVKATTTNVTNSGPFITNTDGSRMPVTVGKNYTSIWYVYADAVSAGTAWAVRIEWRDAGGGLLSTAISATITLAQGWNRCVLAATAPASTVTAIPTFYTVGAQGVVSIWTEMGYFGLTSNLFTLQDPTPVPANRFVNWTGDVNRIVDREVPVGTGIVSEFLFRRDGIASFEVHHLTPAQLGTAASLKDTLQGNSGFAIVTTADNNNAIYCMSMAPGSEIKFKLMDKALYEYSMSLTLKNLAFYNQSSGANTPMPTVDYR